MAPSEWKTKNSGRTVNLTTILHRIVREHLSFSLKPKIRYPSGELPRFIRAELERYLRCGLLYHGFARVRCSTCHDELLMSFSCKNRCFCPSFAGHRMAGSAAHLRDHVFPAVPDRGSLPLIDRGVPNPRTSCPRRRWVPV